MTHAAYRSAFPELDDLQFDRIVAPLATQDAWLRTLLLGSPPGAPVDAEEYPFQRLIRTLASRAARLVPIARPLGASTPGDVLLAAATDRAEERLRTRLSRVLIAGLVAARDAGRLNAPTPESRYEEFVEQCRTNGIAAASGVPFALVEPLVERVVTQEAAFVAELDRRLDTCRPRLAAELGVAPDTPLVDLGTSAGDTHHGGRSVSILTFGDGSRVVYKPRSTSSEAAWAGIAADVNARFGTALGAARVVDAEDHGFVEYLPVADVTDVTAFFAACGELAAVLYLLNARDMHFENILATAGGPVPVDLEALLHPPRVYTGALVEADESAERHLAESVSSIGILPLVLQSSDGEAVVDLGFLGAHEGGRSLMRALVLDGAFTDQMTLRLDYVESGSRPGLAAGLDEAEMRGVGDAMSAAFRRVLDRVVDDPHSWETILRRHCTDVTLRYIHNPTAAYGRIQQLMISARALDDAEYATAVLKRVALLSPDSDRRLVESELRQLAAGDIPYFSVNSSTTEVREPDGTDTGARLAVAPIDAALAKLRRLSGRVVDSETRALRLPFVARYAEPPLADDGRDTDDRRDTDDERAVAVAIADDLVASMLPDRFVGQPATWLGPIVSADDERSWARGVLGIDLYTGRTGPALALLHAGVVLDRAKYTAAAAQVFDPAARIVLDDDGRDLAVMGAQLGAFTGLGGLAFSLTCAGELAAVDEWSRAGVQLARHVLRELAGPQELPLDVIEGVSGVVLALREVRDPEVDDALLDATRGLAAAVLDGSSDASSALCRQSGVAHGVAGPLLALSSLLARSGDDPLIVDAAQHLWDRLDGFYDTRRDRWASRHDDAASHGANWCHGASGILLAVDAYQRAAADDLVARRRRAAIRAIETDGFGRNLTWCHGDLGNHDALVAVTPDTPAAADAVARWLRPAAIARRLADPRSRYAHANAVMVGRSGVLIHLLNRIQPHVQISPTRLTWTRPGKERR